MYSKILVALDHTSADDSLLPHVTELAKLCGASLLLVHVADGWVARYYRETNLAESEEMREDRAYLEKRQREIADLGLPVESRLAMGDPSAEILRVGDEAKCDLIAMTSHGHRLIGDIFYGSTIEKVRHKTEIPLLIVRAK